MSRKCGLSEEEICNLLQPTSYSESEGEDIGIESDDEYIPPPCSSSDGSLLLNMCVLLNMHMLLNMRVCYRICVSVTEYAWLLLNEGVCY